MLIHALINTAFFFFFYIHTFYYLDLYLQFFMRPQLA